mmetsp:Transcript_47239/g.102972  ORF Transcript_47239/g.102972 Transcript_47239/m.102972 type:complete len:172 (-) Transcript_47239:69-584(-)
MSRPCVQEDATSCSSVLSNGSPESEASWQLIREPSLAAFSAFSVVTVRSGDRALTVTAAEGSGEVRQNDLRSRDENDSAAGEIDAALREVSKSTLETENWYPEDSMELDAVLAEELGFAHTDLGRCRFPENCMLQAMRSPQFKSPIMRLDVFLDEDIPEFPFAKVKSVRAA